MSLHLTICELVRDPGFSRSECLDLARRIETGGESLWDDLVCDDPLCDGQLRRTSLSPREEHVLVAALRAYAA